MKQNSLRAHYMHTLAFIRTLAIVVLSALFISACASSGSPSINEPASNNNGSRITVCKTNDTQISDSSQCLQDDAACYQLSNNQWCTGERGNICPAGSVALPEGSSCPVGKRCFSVGESLQCTIS